MNTLDRTLALVAGREPDEAHVQAAQRKLEAATATWAARVARAPAAPRRIGGWLAATASAAVLAVVLLWSPFTSTPALAFSTVQQHFRDFRTLRFGIEQRMNGQVLMESRVHVTRDGDVRTDIGKDLTVIVNNAQQRVVVLQHQARVAMVMPLRAAARKEDALRWLDDIRDFQGAAEPLQDVRTIGGQRAHGWRLEAGGNTIVLWANEDGLPLEMTVVGDASPLQLDFHFEFDLDLEPQMFSTAIPAGYSLGKEED